MRKEKSYESKNCKFRILIACSVVNCAVTGIVNIAKLHSKFGSYLPYFNQSIEGSGSNLACTYIASLH